VHLRLERLGRLAIAFAAMLLSTLVLVPSPAAAGIDRCSISSTGIAFSPYNSQTKTAMDGAGTITVTCSGDSATNSLSLNITGGNSGDCSPRYMRSGANQLAYQIYREASRVNAFCDGGSRLDINMDLSSGSQTRTFTMYGRVTGGQNPVYAPAGYADNLITITLKRGGGTLASTTTSITGSVAAICTVSAGTLGFGTYSGAVLNATAGITVNCSNGAGYQVGLDDGANPSGTARRMAGPGTARLSYQLFRDSARTLAWGDGSALGARVGGTGSGSNQSLTVYGRIPAGQSVAAGSYTDSVVVTVEY